MTAEDVSALDAILNFLQGIPPGWAIVYLIGGAIAFRLVKGSSLKDLFGLTNGYIREREYKGDMKELKELAGRQTDAIKDLRGKVQEIDVKVGKLETQLEQYRK